MSSLVGIVAPYRTLETQPAAGGLATSQWFANLMGISLVTFRRWRREGKIGPKPVKLNSRRAVRFNVQEALDWVRNGCVPPERPAERRGDSDAS
jgi:hypothetical protein